MVEMKITLDISAERILHSVQLRHENIEKQIAAGIEKGIAQLTQDNNFEELVIETTKQSLIDTVKSSVNRWELKHKIQSLLNEKINQKLDVYADQIAEQLLKNIK